MTDHPNRARDEDPPPIPQAYACLQCVGEHKQAQVNGVPDEELPAIEVAVTLAPLPIPGAGVAAVPTCYHHLAVTRTSPLVPANGALPPGLRRPGG